MNAPFAQTSTIGIGGSPPSSATTSTPSAGSASMTSGIGHPTAPSAGSPSTLAGPPSTTKFIGDYLKGKGQTILTKSMQTLEQSFVKELHTDLRHNSRHSGNIDHSCKINIRCLIDYSDNIDLSGKIDNNSESGNSSNRNSILLKQSNTILAQIFEKVTGSLELLSI